MTVQEVAISYDTSELDVGLYLVTIKGYNVSFNNKEEIVRMIKDAEKISFYCMTNGMARIDVEFGIDK